MILLLLVVVVIVVVIYFSSMFECICTGLKMSKEFVVIYLAICFDYRVGFMTNDKSHDKISVLYFLPCVRCVTAKCKFWWNEIKRKHKNNCVHEQPTSDNEKPKERKKRKALFIYENFIVRFYLFWLFNLTIVT